MSPPCAKILDKSLGKKKCGQLFLPDPYFERALGFYSTVSQKNPPTIIRVPIGRDAEPRWKPADRLRSVPSASSHQKAPPRTPTYPGMANNEHAQKATEKRCQTRAILNMQGEDERRCLIPPPPPHPPIPVRQAPSRLIFFTFFRACRVGSLDTRCCKYFRPNTDFFTIFTWPRIPPWISPVAIK